MKDLPAFAANSYTITTGRADQFVSAWGDNTSFGGAWVGDPPNDRSWNRKQELAQYVHLMSAGKEERQQPMAANGKAPLRVVRVFLVDPDERVPVDKRILYRSDEMTTDATDQELFFSIPVNELLKTHNAMRAEVEWEEKTSEGTKSKSGLKEARIRDLVMSVTTVASFASVAA